LVLLKVIILIQPIQKRDALSPEEDDFIKRFIRKESELQGRHEHQVLILAQLVSHSLGHVEGTDPWSLNEARKLGQAIGPLINSKGAHSLNAYPNIPSDLHKRRIYVKISHTRGSKFRRCWKEHIPAHGSSCQRTPADALSNAI
jgi:hypothetical protein